MEALEELPPERFEFHEWVALKWVRNYLLYEGDIPDDELTEAFENLFPPRLRVGIFSVFKLMFFFNMLVNTVRRERFEEGAACAIHPPSIDEQHPGD